MGHSVLIIIIIITIIIIKWAGTVCRRTSDSWTCHTDI